MPSQLKDTSDQILYKYGGA